MPDLQTEDLRECGGIAGDIRGIGGPPKRRRGAPPVIQVVTPNPPARRRAPPPAVAADPWVAEAEAEIDPMRLTAKGMLTAFHRPLPLYWQLHGAPDYIRRHVEDLHAIRKCYETDNRAALDKMTCQSVVNCFMYEDGLRRFYDKPQLTDDHFKALTAEMICAMPQTHTGCHTDIINIDGPEVMMRWHTGSGEIVRDNINAVILYKIIP